MGGERPIRARQGGPDRSGWKCPEDAGRRDPEDPATSRTPEKGIQEGLKTTARSAGALQRKASRKNARKRRGRRVLDQSGNVGPIIGTPTGNPVDSYPIPGAFAAMRACPCFMGPPQSLSENGEGFCLGGKGSIGKARGGSRPAAVCDRQATPPAGPSLPNPPGGGSFRLGLRWFGRNRPQEVCPAAHRLAQPRIPPPQAPSPFSDRL